MLYTDDQMSLMLGDCLECIKSIQDDTVDLILTDPPYNIANFMRTRQVNLKRMRSNFFGSAGWDDIDYEDWVDNIDQFFSEAKRVVKKGGAIIIFMSLMHVETVIKLGTKHGFYYKTTGIWHKTNPMPRNMNLHFINSVEGWIYFINDAKTGIFNNNGKVIHDYIETSVASGREKQFGGHPTQKPEALLTVFVNALTNSGDMVFDPFMGCGSTGVVCENLERQFIGIELNPEYYDIALKRINATRNKLSKQALKKEQVL